MTLNAPTTGPDSTWEEFYGPDYPYNWITDGQPHDTPVLANGWVRVRYDSGRSAPPRYPGFRVEIWNGTSYQEQGKMIVWRDGDAHAFLDTFVGASLVEYTPDRAVMMVVLKGSTQVSYDRIYITVQRGEKGVKFECYPSPTSAGANADVMWQWTICPGLSVNGSVAKVESHGVISGGVWTPDTGIGGTGLAVYAATAGTGAGTGNSGPFLSGATTLGVNADFSAGEPWVSILNFTAYATLASFQHNLIIRQNALRIQYGTDVTPTAYSTTCNEFRLSCAALSGLGYSQVKLTFTPTSANQCLEAETMTAGAGTTLNAVDAAASNGHASTSTRTSDANAHLSTTSWPSAALSGNQYRLFARVKVSASTGNFYLKNLSTSVQNHTVTTTSTSYLWLDFGETTGGNIEIHAWLNSAGTISVDRVEAILTQNRGSGEYAGVRDQAQAAQYDSRQLGAVVARG